MVISLIGMSGSGKTHWSKKLQSQGFKCYCCDDLIERKLEAKLKELNYSGIQDVARWMGQPYDSQYPDSSQTYLDFEQEVLEEILYEVQESLDRDENIVVDTTGSVIYLDPEVLERLLQLTKVVYLQTPETVKEVMYRLYMEDPKPVVWGKSFVKKPDEDETAALKRCYPELLMYRTEKYEQLADVTLDYFQLRDENIDVTNFIKLID